MTITFENDNDVIVYALEKIISYARRTQHIFVAQCVWWLASVIGLEGGLVNHIGNLRKETDIVPPELSGNSKETTTVKSTDEVSETVTNIHPDRVAQVTNTREVSATPRDLAEDKRLDQVLDRAEQTIKESEQVRGSWQKNRINPLPQTKAQLKKARKAKFVQTRKDKAETERQERLQQIRDQVIEKLRKDGLV